MTELPQRFVHPDTVTSHFLLREGDVVADYGTGRGYFLKQLSTSVGDEGVVHAIEVQKNLVEAAGALAESEGLSNVKVQWADVEESNGIRLPDGSVDVGVLVNTLFQLDDKSAALTEIVRTLRPGAKLCIVDWSESFNNLGPEPDAVLIERDARALAETAGLVFDRTFAAGEHHYGLAYRKP